MTNTPNSDTTSAGLALSHSPFAKPPLHIPNGAGAPYKTELVELRSPERTIKWNFWHLPDDDRAPHNHPWDFETTIIHGGYTEERFTLEETFECPDEVIDPEQGVTRCVRVKCHTLVHRAGDVVHVPRTAFHRVISVEPGTVTRMVCGPIADGEWGYLNPETGEYHKAAPDPSFIGRLRALNAFM